MDIVHPSFNLPPIQKPLRQKRIGDVPPEILKDLQDAILKYDFDGEEYITLEKVFYGSRRIVARDSKHRNKTQIYAPADFDDNLMRITQPIRDYITSEILPNHVHILVQVAGLLPAQSLRWHVDNFLYQQYSNKIHIPIFTNNGASFDTYVDGKIESKRLDEGGIWCINNLCPHTSNNRGSVKRIHLIVDFMHEDIFAELEKTDMNYIHTQVEFMNDRLRNIWKELHEAIAAYPATPTYS